MLIIVLLSDTDNYKNTFFVSDEGPADDINGSVGPVQKNLVSTLVK